MESLALPEWWNLVGCRSLLDVLSYVFCLSCSSNTGNVWQAKINQLVCVCIKRVSFVLHIVRWRSVFFSYPTGITGFQFVWSFKRPNSATWRRLPELLRQKRVLLHFSVKKMHRGRTRQHGEQRGRAPFRRCPTHCAPCVAFGSS